MSMPTLRIVFIVVAVVAGGCTSPHRYLVTTPTPCHTVERVDGNRVYLRSSDRICIQSLGSVPVTLDRSYDEVEVYTDGRFWGRVSPRPAAP